MATHVYIWQVIAVLLLALPLAITAVFAIAWRRPLAKPWAFFILGSCVLYVAYLIIGELVFTQPLTHTCLSHDQARRERQIVEQ